MKRTLKRELKVLEIVKREAIEFSISHEGESIRRVSALSTSDEISLGS